MANTLALRYMAAETENFADFEGGHAIKTVQRCIQIDENWIFSVQMDIGLGNIPCAVFTGKLRVAVGIHTDGDSFGHQVSTDHMLGMAVFTVEIVGDGYLGLESAQLLNNETEQVIPEDTFLGIVIVSVVNISVVSGSLLGIGEQIVRRSSENRVVPDAYRPKTIQHFVDSEILCIVMIGHIDNLNRIVLIDRIVGEKPTKEDLLIIAMGGKQQ